VTSPPAQTWPIVGPGRRRTSLVLDRAGARALDQAAMTTYGIPGIVLMENAARALLDVAVDMRPDGDARCVLIVCGAGNNGGDGWALARHLRNAGVEPVVYATKDPRPDSDAGINCAICRRMGITETASPNAAGDIGLIVDGLFGTGLDRPVTGAALACIEWINAHPAPVLAIDLPSGLDADRGVPLGACVRATRTVTMAGVKAGFLVPGADAWVGAVSVADIGAPREAIDPSNA